MPETIVGMTGIGMETIADHHRRIDTTSLEVALEPLYDNGTRSLPIWTTDLNRLVILIFPDLLLKSAHSSLVFTDR